MKTTPASFAGALLVAVFFSSCASQTGALTEIVKVEPVSISIPEPPPPLPLPQIQKAEEPRTETVCETLKLGAVLPLSGEPAVYGQRAKNGIELAVKIFNSKKKSKVTVVYNDSEEKNPLSLLAPWGSPEIAVKEFYKTVAADSSTVGIIGPVHNNSITLLAELAETHKVPTISPSAFGLKKPKDSQYFYANSVFPEDEGKNIAEFAFNVLKKKRAAVIYPGNNAYGSACAAAFKEELVRLGGEVTREEAFKEGSYDFKEQMVNLGGVDPHIIKNIIAADKSNLESIIAKLVLQLRAFFPAATEKKRNSVIMLKFTNAGRENEQMAEDFDFARIISEKLSYGLGKHKDILLPKMAEVKSFIEKKGFNKKALAEKFGAGIIISGLVSEKTPLNYNCKVTVENLKEKTSVEVLFDFTVSDKLVTNPYELEAVYLPVSAYDAESLLSHLIFFELKVPYLGNSRLNDKKFTANVKQNEGELYYTAEFNAFSTIPIVADFVQAYKDSYFEVPDYYSAAAYDAANIFLQAIAGGAFSKEEVKNSIRNISTMNLVTGNISFDGAALRKELHIMGIKDKELIELK